MTSHSLSWAVVDRTADALGATEAARRKWRQSGRGVPSVWRIKIAERLMADGVPVALSAFDHLEPSPGRIAA